MANNPFSDYSKNASGFVKLEDALIECPYCSAETRKEQISFSLNEIKYEQCGQCKQEFAVKLSCSVILVSGALNWQAPIVQADQVKGDKPLNAI